VALSKLCRLYFKEKQIDCLARARVIKVKRLAAKERSRAFETQVTVLVYLLCLKKVYKKIHLKKYCLVEQGFYKLESKKRNPDCPVVETNPNNLVVEFSLVPKSPLTNSFFDPSFSLLPNLVSFNTP